MRAPRVLVVDDDRLFCESLVDHFAGRGVRASYVTSLGAAVAQPLERFSVVVVDNHLPDGSGLSLIDAAHDRAASPSFIMVTGDPSYEHAVASMRSRVIDYLSKPIELEALTGAVMRAFPSSAPVAVPVEEVVLPDVVARYARSEVPILISGETGTGKTQLARRIHLASARATGPFISINCASLPESIIEAELFGSCRGAFTGSSDRQGLLEAGHGGTIFLDEIGELSPTVQAKLLTVLEDRRVRRIGSVRWQELDVRIVAATHVDLRTAVAEGRFRADLLYRLDVGSVRLPPLREQPRELSQAIPTLLRELGAPAHARLADGELQRLTAHGWPGNYRELRNALARALVLQPPQMLRPSEHIDPVPPAVPAQPAHPLELASAPTEEPTIGLGTSLSLAELERRHVLAMLEQNEGHRGRTAQVLGISEATLRRKLRAWQLDE